MWASAPELHLDFLHLQPYTQEYFQLDVNPPSNCHDMIMAVVSGLSGSRTKG